MNELKRIRHEGRVLEVVAEANLLPKDKDGEGDRVKTLICIIPGCRMSGDPVFEIPCTDKIEWL